MVIYASAYIVRPAVCDGITRKYFFPALTLKIIGAIAVGLLYQFYYDGGDTFNYHTEGSRLIWKALTERPLTGLRLFFSNGEHNGDIFQYSSQILYFRDANSFMVVRIATLFDLITFSTYSATAALFAVLSFAGMWLFFLTFYRMYPHLERWFAICCLFVPSVVFWGSGIFKDTLTLAALGLVTFSFHKVFIDRGRLSHVLGLFIGLMMVYTLKKYVLLCFLPALLLWFSATYFAKVRSTVLRAVTFPFVTVSVIVLGYFAILKVGEDDPRYNLNRLAETVKITAYDIRYGWGARFGEGSGYTLGELDGSWQSMLRLAPQAINVSLFRPYFWEVSNVLMLLSAMESFVVLVLTLYVLFKARQRILLYLVNPEVIFALTFALIFAFAVGISTYNFGTLSRYKIPMQPFYLISLVLIWDLSNRREESQNA